MNISSRSWLLDTSLAGFSKGNSVPLTFYCVSPKMTPSWTISCNVSFGTIKLFMSVFEESEVVLMEAAQR